MSTNHYRQKVSCSSPRLGVQSSALIWPPLIQGNPASLFWLLNVTEQPTIPVTLPGTATGFASNSSRISDGPFTVYGRPTGSCGSTRKWNAQSGHLTWLSLPATPLVQTTFYTRSPMVWNNSPSLAQKQTRERVPGALPYRLILLLRNIRPESLLALRSGYRRTANCEPMTK